MYADLAFGFAIMNITTFLCVAYVICCFYVPVDTYNDLLEEVKKYEEKTEKKR